jgi:hypothetical protein
MDELSGTENRISVARHDYNAAVQRYNNRIVTFPSRMIADFFGMQKAEYFQASEGAQTPPKVDFGTDMKRFFRLIPILALLFVGALLMGADVSPTADFYVNDYAGVLSSDTKSYILESSASLAQQTGAQIVVLTVDSLGGKTKDEYALEVGRDWESAIKRRTTAC